MLLGVTLSGAAPARWPAADGEAAFFQFSKEKDRKAKLRRDVKRSTRRSAFQTLVCEILSPTRGVDRDALAKEIRKKHAWKLMIFSRAWLRLAARRSPFRSRQKVPRLGFTTMNVSVWPAASASGPVLLGPATMPFADASRTVCVVGEPSTSDAYAICRNREDPNSIRRTGQARTGPAPSPLRKRQPH